MYKLYGQRGSGAAMVEAALAEAGAPYEFVGIDLDTDEQRGAEFRKLNPAGKIPALMLPSGAVITESGAMLITIAERFPDAKLLAPVGSDERAHAIRWTVFAVAEVYPMIEIFDYPKRFATGEREEAAVKLRAQTRARERWMIVEKEMAASPWILSSFSIADLAVACVSRWTLGKDWRPPNIPKMEAMNKAIFAREKAGKVWTHHFGDR
jgi:GST-like protein